MNPNQSETKFSIRINPSSDRSKPNELKRVTKPFSNWFGMIRIGSDTDIGLDRNSSDWLGINFYPILSLGQIFLGWKKNKTDFLCEICGEPLSPDEKEFNLRFPNHSKPFRINLNETVPSSQSESFGFRVHSDWNFGLDQSEPDWFLTDLHRSRFRTFFGLVRNDSEWLGFARIKFQFETFARVRDSVSFKINICSYYKKVCLVLKNKEFEEKNVFVYLIICHFDLANVIFSIKMVFSNSKIIFLITMKKMFFWSQSNTQTCLIEVVVRKIRSLEKEVFLWFWVLKWYQSRLIIQIRLFFIIKIKKFRKIILLIISNYLVAFETFPTDKFQILWIWLIIMFFLTEFSLTVFSYQFSKTDWIFINQSLYFQGK